MRIYTFLTSLLKFQASAICKFLTNLTSPGTRICIELAGNTKLSPWSLVFQEFYFYKKVCEIGSNIVWMLDCKLVKSILYIRQTVPDCLLNHLVTLILKWWNFENIYPYFIFCLFPDIEFPSHVMLGQSVSMKCTFTKKENQQVKKIFFVKLSYLCKHGKTIDLL